MLTTVQDWPGRIGYWHVGRAAVRADGRPVVPDRQPRAGKSRRRRRAGMHQRRADIALSRRRTSVRHRRAGDRHAGRGRCRTMAVDQRRRRAACSMSAAHRSRDALLCAGRRAACVEPEYLGSTATFTMGAFGGHDGRPLRAGDVLTSAPIPGRITTAPTATPGRHRGAAQHRAPLGDRGHRGSARRAGVLHPRRHRHADRHRLHRALQLRSHRRAAGWARSRSGPAPTAARPACIRRTSTTTPTASAHLDFTGDTPILLGPDGPSLGGFVCPVTVVGGDRWKLGQMAPATRCGSFRCAPTGRRRCAPSTSTGGRRFRW